MRDERVSWIFGYGSLMWRPGFDYLERRPGWIEGWTRRFWQGSVDHRGVPDAPGRVATLVRSHQARCWGMSYALSAHTLDAVLRRLDYREKGGYERFEVRINGNGHAPVGGLIYIATPENRNFLGEASIAEIAEQIARSAGPSGTNIEYVVRLADAIRGMGAEDDELFALENEVQRRMARMGGA